MSLQTPVYGIKYPAPGEPIRNTRQSLQDNANSIEAALIGTGVHPPSAPDLSGLAALTASITALQARLVGDLTLGDSQIAASVLLAAGVSSGATTWTDVATVTASCDASPVAVRFSLVFLNGGSGADRTANLRVICDATQLTTVGGTTAWSNIPVPLAAPRVPRFGAFEHTPSAATHTWKLQANASIASAVYAESASMTVVELGHR